MASLLLLLATMALLDLVFRYRTLIGRCELSLGLSFEEIDELCGLEAALRYQPSSDEQRRRFRRSTVSIPALLRGETFHDHVKISQLGAGGLECQGAPFVEEGTMVELIIDVEDHSYRFSARAVALREDGADYRVGFAFEGVPVLVQSMQSGAAKPDTATSRLMASIYDSLSVAA
jgi:PilZ domain